MERPSGQADNESEAKGTGCVNLRFFFGLRELERDNVCPTCDKDNMNLPEGEEKTKV